MKRIATLLVAAALALLPAALMAKDDKAMEKKPAAEAKADAKGDAKKEDKLDINSATDKELAMLPGIGEARAAAIIKGRPYKAKDELVDKKVIPKAVYDKIKDRIIAKQG